MAKPKNKKKAVVTKPVKTAKQPKIVSITAFAADGASQCFGLGADGKLYGWRGLQPAHWVLQEFAAPSAEEIAARLAAHQEANKPKTAEAPKEAVVPANRHERRALKAVGEKAPATEAFE